MNNTSLRIIRVKLNNKPFSSKHDGIHDPKVKSTRSACLIIINFLKEPIIYVTKSYKKFSVTKCKQNNTKKSIGWLTVYCTGCEDLPRQKPWRSNLFEFIGVSTVNRPSLLQATF